MDSPTSEQPEDTLRDAVDRALIDMLTASTGDDRGADDDRARAELTRAVGLLDEHPQLDTTVDGAHLVRTAAEHLSTGSWEEARATLVTARGRLARPENGHTMHHRRQ